MQDGEGEVRMNDGQTPAESVPPQAVPPTSPLGAIVGWTLLALGVACLIAVVITWSLQMSEPAHHAVAAYNQAISAKQSHEAAAKAADAAYDSVFRALRLRAALLLSAFYVSIAVVPGLLYAVNPSLLGGPLGRLLRRIAANARVRRPRKRYPLSIDQGLGCAVVGIGGTIQAMAIEAATRFGGAWLIEIAMVLWLVALLTGFFLPAGGVEGFRQSRTAQHGDEQPRA